MAHPTYNTLLSNAIPDSQTYSYLITNYFQTLFDK